MYTFFSTVIAGALGSLLSTVANVQTVVFMGVVVLAALAIMGMFFPKVIR